MHGVGPLSCGYRVNIEDGEALAFADANAQHAHTAFRMVDLLQIDLLPAQRDIDFAQFGDFRHICLQTFGRNESESVSTNPVYAINLKSIANAALFGILLGK